MKLFDDKSDDVPSVEMCAALVADTIPLVMRMLRAEMRSHRSADLSVPQFRALAFIARHPGTSLSEVADHIGLTLPSISKMIDRLMARDLVARREASDDRRRVCLELTPRGQATWRSSTRATRTYLAELFDALSPEDREIIIRAMNSLRRVFDSEPLREEDSNG